MKPDPEFYIESKIVARLAKIPIYADEIYLCNRLFDQRLRSGNAQRNTEDLLRLFLKAVETSNKENPGNEFEFEVCEYWWGSLDTRWKCRVTARVEDKLRILIFEEVAQ